MATGGEGVRTKPSIEKDGSRAIQAGFIGTGLVGATLATFGPLFFLPFAYILLAAAGVAALFGLWSADRVSHAGPHMGRAARRDARIGRVLSSLTILFVLYYTGLWILFLVVWPVTLFLGLFGWMGHRIRIAAANPAMEAGT